MACLRYDYVHGTVASSSMPLTAAGSARRPGCEAIANGEQWFVLAVGGIIARYGLVNADIDISDDITASQSGMTVTASAAFFTPEHVGRTLVFTSGAACAITDYVDSTHVLVTPSQTVAAVDFKIVPGVWHRIGLDYLSELDGAWLDFGIAGREKELKGYSAQLAEKHSRPALAQLGETGLTYLTSRLSALTTNILPLGPWYEGTEPLISQVAVATVIGQNYYWFKGNAVGLGTENPGFGFIHTITASGIFTATESTYYVDVEHLRGSDSQTTSRLYELPPLALDFENFFRLGRVKVNTVTALITWSKYQAQSGNEFDTDYYTLVTGSQAMTLNTHFQLDSVNGLVRLLPAYPLNAPLFEADIVFTFNCAQASNAFRVKLYGGNSPGAGIRQLASKLYANPDTNFFLPTHFKKHLFQDRILVSGAHNPARLALRAFEIHIVDSNQIGRAV